MRLTGRRYPMAVEPVIHRTFEITATSDPSRIAVTCGSHSISYGDLHQRANQLACYLSSLGTGPGSVVGICLDRSLEMVICMLGILKAGAAYMPMDTTYPCERLNLMSRQVPNLTVVIASEQTADMARGCGTEVINFPDLSARTKALPTTTPPIAITGNDLCYVVFTSGSTGTPKAVGVKHEGWLNLLNWLAIDFSLDSKSSNLMVSPFGFDISQRSLMTPLFTGATLHLLPSRSFDAMMARRLIKELAVQTLHCAPSALYLLTEGYEVERKDALASVDFIFVGGEPLSARRLERWASRSTNKVRLVNVYGVAECTDVSSYYILKDYKSYMSSGVPIGKPIHNVDIHILNDELTTTPPSEPGEICISGLGVSAGYINSKALNEQRFVKVADRSTEVAIYRTGDIGYVRSDGEIMCIGRVDHQVKIRGMRVDLGDVETTLRNNNQIEDAIVVATSNSSAGETKLTAFVKVTVDPLDHELLRTELLAILPKHMIPDKFIATPTFPLTPNGKIDRELLARQANCDSSLLAQGSLTKNSNR